MTFTRENVIKATRKRHVCAGCNKFIEVGESAINWAGMTDCEFNSVHYHPDCRAAECALNDLHDNHRYGDWMNLVDIDEEDLPWLEIEHPLVFRRLSLSREQWAAEVSA